MLYCIVPDDCLKTPNECRPRVCFYFCFQGKLGVPGLPGYPGRQGPKVSADKLHLFICYFYFLKTIYRSLFTNKSNETIRHEPLMKQKLSSLINSATVCTALFLFGQALRLTCKACCSLIACVNRFNSINSLSMTLTALSLSHPACNKCRPVNSLRLCRNSLCCDVCQLIQSVQEC